MYLKAIQWILSILFCATTLNFQSLSTKQDSKPDSGFRPYLIALVAADVDKTTEWYREKLGFDVIRSLDFPQYDGLRIVFMKREETELELIQKGNSFPIKKFVPDYDGFDKAPLIGIAKIAFWVSDVDALAGSLQAKKVKVLRTPYDDKDFGIRSLIIEDLDGNVLQFNQKLTARIF
jgi:catechol 2,3-dioxygenase-like lactoylglutathione lyase family enzyme